MKKTSVFLIAFALVLLFASSAFGAQASYFNSTAGATYYTPTTISTTSSTYSVTYDGGSLERLKSVNKFAYDNKSNYPYEIYLPNENPSQYRIHTNYTKNTDACASCHSTHTAVGPSLLQWYTVYETCVACHDGTVTTTYNVINGEIGERKNPAYGGMFGIGTETSLSNHNVSGAVDISAAPGGSVASKEVTKGYGQKTIMWQSAFGCESCHTPHGQGGNARILSPDPNGYATYKNSFTNLEVNGYGNIHTSTDQYVYVPLITGYPYKVTIKFDDSPSVEYLVKNDGLSVSGGAYSYITKKDGTAINSDDQDRLTIEGVVGYQVRMQIDNYLNNGNKDGSTLEKVSHVSGINDFCGACHTDYNTEPLVKSTTLGNGIDTVMGVYTKRPGYDVEYGEFSKAHRHAVGLKWNYANAADSKYIGWSNKPMMTTGLGEDGKEGSSTPADDSYISCLTCHFAHGTSQDFWKIWVNNATWSGDSTEKYTNWAPDELKEIAGSSALKRLPNMGTCEACHQKGVDAQGYAINTGQTLTTTANIADGIFALGNYSNKESISNADCTNAICHEHTGMDTKFNFTKMGNAGTQTAIKCIDCHGGINAANHLIQPSALNIENPRNKTIAEQTAKCMTCHTGPTNGATSLQGNWDTSAHKNSGVISCTTCHDSHKLSSEGISLKREYHALCSSCHGTTFEKLPAKYH